MFYALDFYETKLLTLLRFLDPLVKLFMRSQKHCITFVSYSPRKKQSKPYCRSFSEYKLIHIIQAKAQISAVIF